MATPYDTARDLYGQSTNIYSSLSHPAQHTDPAAAYAGGQFAPQAYSQMVGSSINEFVNPYLDQVLNRALSRMGDTHQTQLTQIGDAAQASGAFGGSRHALLEAKANEGYQRNVGDLTAQTSADAFSQALSAALSASQQGGNMFATTQNLSNADRTYDLERALAAARGLSGAGRDYYTVGNDQLDRVLNQGEGARQLQQQVMSGADQTFQAYNNDPYADLELIQALLGGSPRAAASSSTQSMTQPVDLFGTLLQAAGTAIGANGPLAMRLFGGG